MIKLQEIVFLISKSFSDTVCISGEISALLPASNSMEMEIPLLISPAQPHVPILEFCISLQKCEAVLALHGSGTTKKGVGAK